MIFSIIFERYLFFSLLQCSEYLNINPLIRQQCVDACSTVVSNIQFSPTLTLIICKDKIVHTQLRFVRWRHISSIDDRWFTSFSNEQNRVSNGDTLLLLLNNVSRSTRSQFESQEYGAFRTMAHVYKTRLELSMELSSRNSTGHISTDKDLPTARRVRILRHFSISRCICCELDYILTYFEIRRCSSNE